MNPRDRMSFPAWLLSVLVAAAIVLCTLVLGYLLGSLESVGGH